MMGLSIKARTLCGLLAATMVSVSTPVYAAQGGIAFGGFAGQGRFCVILLVQDGIMAPSVDRTVLSSEEANGRVGKAQVRTARNLTGPQYIVSIEAPTSFISAPSALTSSVQFGASYSSTWQVFAGSDPDGDPNTTPINSGAFPAFQPTTRLRFPRNATRLDMDVHLRATVDSGTFPSGSYSSEVTIRCE